MLIFSWIALCGRHFDDPAVIWGVPDKTGEVDNDQNDEDDQDDATAADMVRIHLNNLFCYKSEILTSEKQELEFRLINILVLREFL